MLQSPTPYPYPGSYALYVDTDLPESEQRLELVRINWRQATIVQVLAMVSFPLRDGASGNKTVRADDLIDGTPLTAEETREFHDLDRGLAGRSMRTAKQKAQGARRDALRKRILNAPVLARLLREAAAKTDRKVA
jgi:hypothetical protein